MFVRRKPSQPRGLSRTQQSVASKGHEQLFPSAADLRPGRSEVAIAPLVAEGRYRDHAALLRAHRDLLIEDYLRALASQLDEVRADPKLLQSTACYVVKGLHVELEPKRANQKRLVMGVRMKFDEKRYQHVKWEDEKRFMTNNLVLLSPKTKKPADAFADPLVGVVTESQPHLLRRGLVIIKMVSGLDPSGHFIMNSQNFFVGKEFYLVDPAAFHFPCLHVTNALSHDRKCNRSAAAHLAPELARCEFPSPRPAYLDKCPLWRQHFLRLRPGLNASQVEAFESVFAHRVALVQGPPGTGKTHLGTEIVKCLVSIKTTYPGVIKGPIFIMTTTNHAVHEILTRCTHFCNKIVHGYSDKHEKADYGPLQRQYNACRFNDERAAVMKEADILAMTTTRAAYMRSTLDLLNIQIVLVEEAAEALEGYALAALPAHTEHLIQIGDHKQLQPSCSHQPLAVSHRLELSLFERLILNGAECPMLNEQRRMRPSISNLVKSIYPALTNHASTAGRPAVRGVDLKTPVVFLETSDHEKQEGKGFINLWEADMAARLSGYLVLQGYPAKEITILTTYRRQLNLIKKLMRTLQGEARHVKATTVDNFQGEENQIIILSLVRSNASGRIGFLAKENRACVALSRARDGFFMLGNLACLVASRAAIWSHVERALARRGRVLAALPLVCPHGRRFSCANAEDVAAAERGCVVCEARAALRAAERGVADCQARLDSLKDDIKTIGEALALGKVRVLMGASSEKELEESEELTKKRAARVKEQLRLTGQLPGLRQVRQDAESRLKDVEGLLKMGEIDVNKDTMADVEKRMQKPERTTSSLLLGAGVRRAEGSLSDLLRQQLKLNLL